MTQNTADADLICIGGGIAGLTCAARAAELGLRVIVLERGTGSDYACNSRYSAGVFHAASRDVSLSPKEIESNIRKAMGGPCNDALVETLAANAGPALEWLRKQGGKFVRDSNGNWVMAPPRGMSTGLDWQGRGPDALLRALTQRITERQGRILLGVRAGKLVKENGAVTGVQAERGEEKLQFSARAIVIADGGFCANPDLIRAHIGPRPEGIFQRNAGTALGDGLTMAIEAGAAHSRLDRFYGHLLSRDVFHNSELWPFPQLDAPAAAGIVVDPNGCRLFDEGLGGIYLSNAIAGMDDPLSTTLICDEKIWESAGREHRVPPNPLLEKHRGTIHRAHSIEALAAMAGLPPDALAETVKGYNAWVDSGGEKPIAPARSTLRAKPQPIRHPPFMAIPMATAITATMGGVSVDTHARALDREGRPIAGLYCVGSALGGLDGGDTVGYVGGLSKSVFGLRAAEHFGGEFLGAARQRNAV